MHHDYAQTHLQLFRQLERAGYSEDDLNSVAKAYDLAARLCPGQYRPSGKPNIEHLVGTASILCALDQPTEIVVAGLLHSIYAHGDFGTLRQGITERKRAVVRAVIGIPAEACIARYATMDWRRTTISDHPDHLARLDSLGRSVLLLRMADRLEDTLDGGVLYCVDAEQRLRDLAQKGEPMVRLAAALGYPRLAAELNQAFVSLPAARLPEGLRNRYGHKRVYLVMPMSGRSRYSTWIARHLLRLIVGLDRAIR